MKEATGELSITVITVVAVAAVATLFYTLVWPAIQKSITDNACAMYGDGWHAVSKGKSTLSGDTAKDVRYVCCDKDDQNCTYDK